MFFHIFCADFCRMAITFLVRKMDTCRMTIITVFSFLWSFPCSLKFFDTVCTVVSFSISDGVVQN